MMNENPIRILVYGTLRAGNGNHHILEDGGATYLGVYKVPGGMRSLGGFPGVDISSQGTVTCEGYAINERTLERLDRLEGHPTFYTRVKEPKTGFWIYNIAEDERLPLIEHGDWNKWRLEKNRS
jgi:gamma-glutamylcyclotransferase (GGCT)/AIG2-like uncharacterized protein YtfP